MGKSPLAEEVGITRRGRWSYARESGTADPRFERTRGSEMADTTGRNSVCKVMHGHESGLNARGGGRLLRDAGSSVCVRALHAAGYLRAISRISQYITRDPRARLRPGLLLSALVAAVMSLCCSLLQLRYRRAEACTRAKDAAT